MSHGLPYMVLYAAQRENCEKCRKTIKQGALKIAIMVQSNEDDFQYPTWYHQKCFFKIRLPATEAAFDGFAQLRYDHQLAIKKDLGLTGDIEIDQKEEVSNKKQLRDFMISYADVTRDSCVECRERFKKNDVRIMRVTHTASADENQNDEIESGLAQWYHVACFVRQRSEIGWLCSGSLLPGFKRLMDKDKEVIKSQIPDCRAIATASSSTGTDSMALEKEIQLQNNEYFKIYDFIQKHVSEDDQIDILLWNDQTIPDKNSQILHHVTDVIYFGAIKTCKSCTMGPPMFSNWTYKCPCELEWSICGNEDKEPKRFRAKLPPNITAMHPTLQEQCGVRKRALHAFKFVDEHGNDLVYAPYKSPLLFNMEFVLIGTFKQARANIEQQIKKLGGKVSAEIHDRVAAIISTADEVQKMDYQMMEAQERNIQVISEDFLDEIQAPDADPILYIISNSISAWGGDPYARIEENEVASRRETIFYTKSLPEKITLKWKDGTAVDPECGLDENAHVYSATLNDEKVYYSVILGLVDIERNKNSYYRMQLLESNDQNLYWVFESWGRIGTVIGSKRISTFGKLDEALKRFLKVYLDKTDNNFGSKPFEKQPNCFYHLDVEVGNPKKMANTMIPTTLDGAVYDLMQMLFDIEKMENMMCGCDLDLKQMPLGKITANQIKMAMSTLNSIEKLIEQNASVNELRDASNKFYTLIPHTFGVKSVPIIDSIGAVSAKNEMLESLLNMETVYSFLEGENGEKTNPLDACYRKLKANIEPMAKDAVEFGQLCSIVKNMHGSTQYTLEVLEIFKVVRDGEDEHFQHELPNHKLLWHGSRLTNFASILSNGLKVAPPEAPLNGYRFGKGIYFADAISKSAIYCFADPDHNTGLMLMCEVALGNAMGFNVSMFDVIDIPNAEFQSVEAFGLYVPHQYQYIDGLLAPLNGFIENMHAKDLPFNEFIVYNANQVKIKYLFKMKFHFKVDQP